MTAADGHRPRLPPELVSGRQGVPQLWGRQGAWQIRLRWAVAPVMIVAVLLGRLLGFEFEVVPIVIIALASPVYNALFALVLSRYHERLETDRGLDRLFTSTEVVADYAAMFLLIYFTGGVSSPLVLFLLFHVIIAAIQFTAVAAHALAGVAAGGLWVFLLGQLGGWLPCHYITFRGEPVHHMDRPAYAVLMLAAFTATLFISAGVVSRISARLRDRVGDLADATQELAATNDRLQTLMQERTQFMLEVAHNLRAPLSAGLGIVDLLSAGYLGDLTEQQREQVERLDRRLRALSQTIGELLEVARVRDRSVEIEDVVVDLAALAERTERLFREEAQRRSLAFEVIVDDGLPPVDSGVGLLDRVMENLVSNAIKYTPEGGKVGVRFQGDGPSAVRVTVSDTGIGIPQAEQGRLFREFFRASNARRLSAEGTGLGLVFVKQTIDRHDGTLELTSEEGRGTTITVRLPARAA